MTKTDQNISFPLDDDYTREVAINDEDTGEPLDLTGCTVKAFIRPSPAAALTYTLTTESNGGLSVVNVQGGVVQVAPTRTVQTALSMTAAARIWALKVLKDGTEKTVTTGTFTITPSNGSIQ